jgi:hypothetical protein
MVELHHLHVESKAMLLLRDLPTSCTLLLLSSPYLIRSLATTSKCKDNTDKALSCTC